jgi:Protein of unknown function (DUF3037)
MPNQDRKIFAYRVVRYTPNLVRDEWVNVGILLEHPAERRVAARLVEDKSEFARVRRLHPSADVDLLRALPQEFESQIATAGGNAPEFLARLDQTLSNALQLSPARGLIGEDFGLELDRLYHDHVAPPASAGRTGLIENTRNWIRTRSNEIFRRLGLLPKLQRGVRVDEFTQPGDPFKLDYAYRNGTRGFLHAVSLDRDPAQAKVLAYTAECIRAKIRSAEFAAITESDPLKDNPRHQFISGVLHEQKIDLVPLGRLDAFARNIRPRLQ